MMPTDDLQWWCECPDARHDDWECPDCHRPSYSNERLAELREVAA